MCGVHISIMWFKIIQLLARYWLIFDLLIKKNVTILYYIKIIELFKFKLENIILQNVNKIKRKKKFIKNNYSKAKKIVNKIKEK